MNKFINIEPNAARGLQRFLDNNSISYERGNGWPNGFTRFEFDSIDNVDFSLIKKEIEKWNAKYNTKNENINTAKHPLKENYDRYFKPILSENKKFEVDYKEKIVKISTKPVPSIEYISKLVNRHGSKWAEQADVKKVDDDTISVDMFFMIDYVIRNIF